MKLSTKDGHTYRKVSCLRFKATIHWLIWRTLRKVVSPAAYILHHFA